MHTYRTAGMLEGTVGIEYWYLVGFLRVLPEFSLCAPSVPVLSPPATKPQSHSKPTATTHIRSYSTTGNLITRIARKPTSGSIQPGATDPLRSTIVLDIQGEPTPIHLHQGTPGNGERDAMFSARDTAGFTGMNVVWINTDSQYHPYADYPRCPADVHAAIGRGSRRCGLTTMGQYEQHKLLRETEVSLGGVAFVGNAHFRGRIPHRRPSPHPPLAAISCTRSRRIPRPSWHPHDAI